MPSGAQNTVCEFYSCIPEVYNGAVGFGLDPEPGAIVVVGIVQVAENVIGRSEDLKATEPVHQDGDGAEVRV